MLFCVRMNALTQYEQRDYLMSCECIYKVADGEFFTFNRAVAHDCEFFVTFARRTN
jgi:hypothetical protein